MTDTTLTIAEQSSDTVTLADIEEQIAKHQQAIADLRSTGIRLAADAGISGQAARKWLTSRGATDEGAGALIVEVIRERRSAAAEVPS